MNNIETMKLALEALEEAKLHIWLGDEKGVAANVKCHQTITALRQAIEQAQQAEPVACGYDETTGNCTNNPCCYTSPPPRQPEQDGVAMADYMALMEKYVALKAAQPKQKPVAIEWTLDGDKSCGYNNWVGNTPFGRILITWKGWKEHHDACVDEFPGEFNAYGTPDEVKAECEAEFARRVNTTPSPRQPLTDEEMFKIWLSVPAETKDRFAFARAIEAAHGITGEKA